MNAINKRLSESWMNENKPIMQIYVWVWEVQGRLISAKTAALPVFWSQSIFIVTTHYPLLSRNIVHSCPGYRLHSGLVTCDDKHTIAHAALQCVTTTLLCNITLLLSLLLFDKPSPVTVLLFCRFPFILLGFRFFLWSGNPYSCISPFYPFAFL